MNKKALPALIPPTNDVVFKYVFGDERNKGITAKLLSAIFGFEVRETDITFGDPHLKREFPDDKLGVLDMFVRLKSGKVVAVEMLTGKFSNIFKRLEYYISKMTVAQLGIGHNYPKMRPVVFILITTKPVLKNTAKYHSEFAMLEKGEHYALHDLRTLHIIELSKLPPDSQGRLAAWLKFMTTKRKEDLMALIKKNPELRSAGKALMSASTEAAIRAYLAQDVKNRRDTKDMIAYAKQETRRTERKKAAAAVAAERQKAEKTVAAERQKAQKAVAAERRKAEKILTLIKQGYTAGQVEKMLCAKT